MKIEEIEEQDYEHYKKVREFVQNIEESCNFKCKMCENTCCTSNLRSLTIYDYFYMKENKIDLSGLNLNIYEKTGQVIGIEMKGKDNNSYQCYYYKDRKCSIHPYNPLMYHCFPFNYKIEDDFYFQNREPSTKRMWIQLFSTRKSNSICEGFKKNRFKFSLCFLRHKLHIGFKESKRLEEIRKKAKKFKRH